MLIVDAASPGGQEQGGEMGEAGGGIANDNINWEELKNESQEAPPMTTQEQINLCGTLITIQWHRYTATGQISFSLRGLHLTVPLLLTENGFSSFRAGR